MSGTKLWTTGKGMLSGSKDHHDYFSLGSWSKSPMAFVFLSRKIKGGSAWILSRVKPLKSPKSELRFWCIQSCSLSSNWLFECEHPFIDKLMVISKPVVPSARLLGLGSNHYLSKKQRMLNKDLTRFMQGLSRVRQNRVSKWKSLLARGKSGRSSRNCVAHETMQNYNVCLARASLYIPLGLVIMRCNDRTGEQDPEHQKVICCRFWTRKFISQRCLHHWLPAHSLHCSGVILHLILLMCTILLLLSLPSLLPNVVSHVEKPVMISLQKTKHLEDLAKPCFFPTQFLVSGSRKKLAWEQALHLGISREGTREIRRLARRLVWLHLVFDINVNVVAQFILGSNFIFFRFNTFIVYYYTPQKTLLSYEKISTELYLFLVRKGTNPHYQRQFYASN